MRVIRLAVLMGSLAAAGCSSTPPGGSWSTSAQPGGPDGAGLKLENLLSSTLEGVEGTEVIVSRVRIPPHTSLPKHWHPGEEFGYVLEGSVTLWQKGKADVRAEKGDVVKVPLKQVHTAVTQEEGVTLLVFRVHERGKPERIMAN